MRKFKLIFTLLSIMALSLPAFTQSGPANPEVGKCYVRCITPDVWESKEVTVVVKPAYKKLEVVPAQYKNVEETIMVKPATKKFVYVPAKFKTVKEEIQVEDTYSALTVVPASFQPNEETVEVRAKHATFEYQKSLANCDKEDPRDCIVLCYVERDAETVTVPTWNLQSGPSTTTSTKGGKTLTVSKQELVSEARVETVEIPAEYRTITKRVLVQGETTREIEVPAETRTETVYNLVKKGGMEVWEEVDCELTDYTVIPVFYELGSARLTSASRKVIDDKLYKLMVEKPNIRIEINSHTDSRGSDSSNMDLSQARAEAVVTYLVRKGISKSRLVAKGYGETRLVNRCEDGVQCSEAEHAKNRRTEFRVIGG